MFKPLPQFVPQATCLSCDGCCRFKDEKTSWRPKVSADEVYTLRFKQPKLASTIFSKNTIDERGHFNTAVHNGCHECQFLNRADNTCRIYENRPFECRLYPFLLRRKEGKILLSVHLSCPHALENRYEEDFEQHLTVLKNYFFSPETKTFLAQNRHLAGDYSGYEKEIEDLFVVLDAEQDKEGRLWNRRMDLEAALLQAPAKFSAYSVANVFGWKDFFDYDLQFIDGCLCIFADNTVGTFMPLPPLGREVTAKVIDRCFELMETKNAGNGVSRIENVDAANLPFFDSARFRHAQKNYDYIYFKDDITGLKGNDYKSQRAAYNQFIRNCESEFKDYDIAMAEDARKLYKKWAVSRETRSSDDIYRHMLKENYDVHRLILKKHQTLGLIGRAVFVGGRLAAYSFGCEISPEMFCVVVEISSPDINGLAPFIFREFCKDPALAPYRFINVMDDFQMDNITRTKMSWRPAVLHPSYTVYCSRTPRSSVRGLTLEE